MAGTVYLASLIPATQFFVLELQAAFGDKLAITALGVLDGLLFKLLNCFILVLQAM